MIRLSLIASVFFYCQVQSISNQGVDCAPGETEVLELVLTDPVVIQIDHDAPQHADESIPQWSQVYVLGEVAGLFGKVHQLEIEVAHADAATSADPGA
jgi:hypothetical protein